MTPKNVLILGSGPLRIGQAGEFDYSGSQAIKALKQEGIRTVLVNPNVATIQTTPGLADQVYLVPVEPDFVQKVIEREHPDAILLNVGGQTALNVGVELWRSGTLKRFGVEVLGTSVQAIEESEDRQRFADRMRAIKVDVPRSGTAESVEQALLVAQEVGYPVMVRAAYSLGGLGSGVARSAEDLKPRVIEALSQSPQVLIEEYLGGWKEVEYEVVRDRFDNAVTVCNMENFDPMGIHTGESIVVAPSQTLTNAEYHRLRSVSIHIVRQLGIIGECNVQFALHPGSVNANPKSEIRNPNPGVSNFELRDSDLASSASYPQNSEIQYRVIEVNARLSRSSALASKATGYPLAWVATKLALGQGLAHLKNAVTGVTGCFFEPALDYVTVKIPRWDLHKFRAASRRIGTEMKSVGEVMAIGACFEEALQKAVRSLGLGYDGLTDPKTRIDDPEDETANPTDRRLYAMTQLLAQGTDPAALHERTKIDPWFIARLAAIIRAGAELESVTLDKFTHDDIRRLKRLGFSDRALARHLAKNSDQVTKWPSGPVESPNPPLDHLTTRPLDHSSVTESEVRKTRISLGVIPRVRRIDTLAGEFPAATNYLYLTYGADFEEVAPEDRGRPVIVLGSGPYCIGSSVEFDWCSVGMCTTASKLGHRTIMINCNPETVSTDFDMTDRLYFEELTLERILDITEFERPLGVVVSVGGQLPNTLARSLAQAGVRLLGTAPDSIDRAENRHRFSSLLDELKVAQPAWQELTTFEEAKQFAARVGYPVLVRPSYVLSGSAMNIVKTEHSLEQFLNQAAKVSAENPVVISKFIEGAKEIEIDGVAQDGELVLYAITEHVELSGVHSGDATVVLPPQTTYLETVRRAKGITKAIARALGIQGPFNVQFLARRNELSVIECNLRASRSFPFVSKATGYNFIETAARAMLGTDVRGNYRTLDLDHVAVKVPQFSFSRLKGADPVLYVEMTSTGEAACLGDSLEEAWLQAAIATGFRLPKKTVLFSIGAEEQKVKLLNEIRSLADAGFELYATRGTHAFLEKHGIKARFAHKFSETRDCPLFVKTRDSPGFGFGNQGVSQEFSRLSQEFPENRGSPSALPSVVDLITSRTVECVVNVPSRTADETTLTDGYYIRRAAADFGVPLVNDAELARLFIRALLRHPRESLAVRPLSDYNRR